MAAARVAPTFSADAMADAVAVDHEVAEVGARLLARSGGLAHLPHRAHERGMALLSRDPDLRTALLRVVDVAPGCGDEAELARHLGAYLGELERRPLPIELIRRAACSPRTRVAVGRVGFAGVRRLAGRFIAGRGAREAAPRLGSLWRRGIASSVDLLGEATVTRAEGRAYAERCERALADLAGAAAGWPSQPHLETDPAGIVPRVNLSVKVTALTPSVRREAPERARAEAIGPLRQLLREARRLGAHLHVDMESVDSREIVLDLLLELLAEPEFRAGPSAGLVLQAYLRDSEEMLDKVLAWAREVERRPALTVRLVKGAYWDHEFVEAIQHGWPPPVHTEKAESDRSFERLTDRLLDSSPLLRTSIASHNLRSVAYAIVRARRSGLGDAGLELQVLRGLGDDLQDALAAEGHRVRTYSPVGDLVAGMAYLVRRLLENTANDSFLAARATGAGQGGLLERP